MATVAASGGSYITSLLAPVNHTRLPKEAHMCIRHRHYEVLSAAFGESKVLPALNWT